MSSRQKNCAIPSRRAEAISRLPLTPTDFNRFHLQCVRSHRAVKSNRLKSCWHPKAAHTQLTSNRCGYCQLIPAASFVALHFLPENKERKPNIRSTSSRSCSGRGSPTPRRPTISSSRPLPCRRMSHNPNSIEPHHHHNVIKLKITITIIIITIMR